ncbi:MAG: hypothetical protein ACREOV_08700, partial [Candidatus Dormibacteraceae bacterium]
LDLIQPEDNLSAVIYGELIAGATIAAAIGETSSVLELAAVTVGTLAVYWVAHAYADFVGDYMAAGGRGHTSVWHTLLRELPMVTACLPPLVVLVLARGLDASPDTACYAALAYVTISLMGYGFRSARRAGLAWPMQIGATLLHAVLGAAIILLKVVLH